MKKALSIGGSLIVVGAIVALVGFFSHRHPFNPFNQETVTQTSRRTLTKKSFNRVKVTATTADVVIKEGTDYNVQYTGRRSANVKAQVSDDQLTVTQTPASRTKHFNFSWSSSTNRIVITVPKGSQLTKLTVKNNADIDLQKVRLAQGQVKTTAGDLSVNNCRLNGGTLTTNSGDLEIDRTNLRAVRLKTDSGDIDLNRVKVNGGKADLASGDFTAHRLAVHGHYLVNNASGDNEVHAANRPGVILDSDSGDNDLGRRHQEDGGTLDHDTANADLIRLATQSGDNSFSYPK